MNAQLNTNTKETAMNTNTIARRRLAKFLNQYLATDYIGAYGYSDVPYYARPGTTGNLFTDRVHAPVRTEVRYANNLRKEDNHTVPAGDIMRWLDECPRGVLVCIPDYSGSHLQGEWRYYKRRDGRWQRLGYWNWELNQWEDAA